MLPLEAASASSLSLGRAVAATLTPAAASRFAISPQMAPEAPVIHATFQGNLSAMHAAQSVATEAATLALADAVAKRLGRRAGHWPLAASCASPASDVASGLGSTCAVESTSFAVS